jgi:hypothetical protein
MRCPMLRRSPPRDATSHVRTDSSIPLALQRTAAHVRPVKQSAYPRAGLSEKRALPAITAAVMYGRLFPVAPNRRARGTRHKARTIHRAKSSRAPYRRDRGPNTGHRHPTRSPFHGLLRLANDLPLSRERRSSSFGTRSVHSRRSGAVSAVEFSRNGRRRMTAL